VREFLDRYDNRNTRDDYARTLTRLFADSGRQHPRELTETDLLRFCTAGNPANNTVYQRASQVRTFLRWCHRTGAIDTNPAELLTDRTSPLRSYRRTYGKVQDTNPGHWLTRDQAYGQLIAACQDGTLVGRRDEIMLRLGLAGMRRAELTRLTLRDASRLPVVTWTGKGHKPRKITAGRALVAAIDTYLGHYDDPAPHKPLLCRRQQGNSRATPNVLLWGQPISVSSVYSTVRNRAQLAQLGQLAPHDLRRTAAGILHNATDDSGAHHFDLLDIQQVLGHSDPAVTMKCYLNPMATDVLDRAADWIDG
jgi:integrase